MKVSWKRVWDKVHTVFSNLKHYLFGAVNKIKAADVTNW